MADRLAVLEASRHGPFLSYDRFDNGDNDADREDSGLYDQCSYWAGANLSPVDSYWTASLYR